MTEPITAEQLAEWRARVAKATPGPYYTDLFYICGNPTNGSPGGEVIGDMRPTRRGLFTDEQCIANAWLFAASPAIVAALLDEVERLRAVIADSLTIEPCHITGMHTPNHHTDYLCAEQMREAWMRLVMAMGLVPESEAGEDVNTYNRRKLRTLHQQLPRRNHDESCYWCEKNGDGWHEVQP